MSRVDFTINPDTIVQVTEKPTRNVFKNPEEVTDIEGNYETLAPLRNAEAVPRAKYNFAVRRTWSTGGTSPTLGTTGRRNGGNNGTTIITLAMRPSMPRRTSRTKATTPSRTSVTRDRIEGVTCTIYQIIKQ